MGGRIVKIEKTGPFSEIWVKNPRQIWCMHEKNTYQDTEKWWKEGTRIVGNEAALRSGAIFSDEEWRFLHEAS